MKKLIALALAAFLMIGCAAAEIDLSSMSFDELIALKDKINLAIWNSAEWQEVTVPQGLWEVGADIPAGKWTIKAKNTRTKIEIGQPDEERAGIDFSSRKNEFTVRTESASGNAPLEYFIEVVEGDFIFISPTFGAAIFSPYTGKPDLGFK